MIKRSNILIAALIGIFVVLTPITILATTRVVVQNTSQCPSDTVTTPCYTSVSDAITAAVAGDSLEIRPGTYTGNFTLNKSVSIYGNETAATFLSGGGSGTILTIDTVTTAAMSIRRLSFISAQTGIVVRNSSSVDITNNVFQVSGAAVQTTSSPTTKIINNTFYRNGNGVLSDSTTLNIINNIFSQDQSGVAISPTNMDLTSIKGNLFFGGSIGPAVITDSSSPDWQKNIADQDPLLVAPDSANITERDFHLKLNSPCINSGDTSQGLNVIGDTSKTDMGAYGGPNTDIVPFRVSGLNRSTSAGSIYVTWKANNSYLVSGYRAYYGSTSGNRSGTGATEGPSPINVTTASTTVSGLSTTVATPGAPTLNPPQALNESFNLSWSAVPSAKRYNVYYGTTSPPTTLAATVDTTSYTLTGLTNGQTYYVAVSAIDQAVYYFTVTAFDSAGVTSGPTITPGVAHESDYSQEISVALGSPVEGVLSNIVSDFPERLSAYPVLPEAHQGCFIATAAYGNYSAPEVQALREFRDRYLLASSLGRAFVGWYYRYSPAAAAALNAHPAFKPVVRAALQPAVGGAYLLTRTSLAFKIGLLMVLGCAALYFNRKRFSRFGGDR